MRHLVNGRRACACALTDTGSWARALNDDAMPCMGSPSPGAPAVDRWYLQRWPIASRWFQGALTRLLFRIFRLRPKYPPPLLATVGRPSSPVSTMLVSLFLALAV